MEELLVLTERVALPGSVIATEPCFDLTVDGVRYLATHERESALADPQDAA
jgi:hypothetical protein